MLATLLALQEHSDFQNCAKNSTTVVFIFPANLTAVVMALLLSVCTSDACLFFEHTKKF